VKRDPLVFVESIGEGDPLVLVHGWGMHGGLMRDLAMDLSENFQVFVVDLPGHGRSKPLLSKIMCRNILFHALFQIAVIFYFLYGLPDHIGIACGRPDCLQGGYPL
jgi:pimeloyl-ACP methyl ester carboxylesterase